MYAENTLDELTVGLIRAPLTEPLEQIGVDVYWSVSHRLLGIWTGGEHCATRGCANPLGAIEVRRVMGSIFRIPALWATPLLCLLATLALTAAAAHAEKIYFPGKSFGEEGTGPGQLKEPIGIAVNDATNAVEEPAAGDVYVADMGNNRVERFSAEGKYLGRFDASGRYFVVENGKEEEHTGPAPPTGAFSQPEQVAVDNCTKAGVRCTSVEDPSVGDVYVTDTGHGVIDRFSPTGEYLGQITQALGCSVTKRPPPCLTGEHEETAPLQILRAVAVGVTGDVWVYGGVQGENEGADVFEFSRSGSFEKALNPAEVAAENHALAVDSHENLYLGGSVHEYRRMFLKEGDPVFGHCEGEGEMDPFSKAMAVAPLGDAQLADELFIDHGGVIERDKPYSLCSSQLEAFPGQDVPPGYPGLAESFGVAVGGAGTVYATEKVADRVEPFDYVGAPDVVTEQATEVSETAITLHATVNPEGEEIKQCLFEYGTEAGKYEHTAPCEQSPAAITGPAPVPVRTKVEGLAPASVRSFRVIAENAIGVSRVGDGLTVARPSTSQIAATNVGTVSTKVTASLNAGSLASCYWVEYGVTAAYGHRAPAEGCLPVGAGREGVPISEELSGLTPDTTYHYRIAAKNALGETGSPDEVFRTFAPTSVALPDGRVTEAVSDVGPGQHVGVYVPHGLVSAGLDYEGAHGIAAGAPSQVALDGETVVYTGDPPPTAGNGSFGNGNGNSYAARRDPGGGWTQVSLNAPGHSNKYLAFSEDLSTGVLQSNEELAAGAAAGYENLFRRHIGWRMGEGGLSEPVLGSFEPLISAGLSCAVDEVGAVEGGHQRHYIPPGGGNAGQGEVPAFDHLLFEVNAALPSMPVAPSTVTGGGEGCGPKNDLYDNVGGRLYLVNVRPDGEAQAGGTFGRGGSTAIGFLSPEKSNAISADGSRIYWSTVAGWTVEAEDIPEALYVREDDTQPQSKVVEVENGRWRCTEPDKACTVQVDASEDPGEEGGGGAFWTASSDGSRAFFTDERRLVTGSTAELAKPDLYEFNVEAPEGDRLSDLSSAVRPGVNADVQGVVGASEDGSYVYFVADGMLTEGANAEGREPVEGQPNVYLRHGGKTVFVATLLPRDDNFTENVGDPGNYGDWQADPAHRTAEVTPDGHSVVFTSRARLTSYDNTVKGTPLAEVYVYNANSSRLLCASCDPSGEPPTADIHSEFAEDISQSEELGEGHKALGSFLPSSEGAVGWADYQPRLAADGGRRVFFDSVEPLAPQDTNGFLDVYEWEAPGEGSCSEADASPVTGGCTYLLSGGQSLENSYLIGASADGNDVFFISRAELVKDDQVPGLDELYDDRVGGVEALAQSSCEGTGCQGVPPAPPQFATAASETYAGLGNVTPSASPQVASATHLTAVQERAAKLAAALKACHRRYPRNRSHRQSCERAARGKYGLAKAKRSRRATQSRPEPRSRS